MYEEKFKQHKNHKLHKQTIFTYTYLSTFDGFHVKSHIFPQRFKKIFLFVFVANVYV